MIDTFINLFKLNSIKNFFFGKSLSWWFGLIGVVSVSLFWIVMTFWQNTFALDQAIHLTVIRNLTSGDLQGYGPNIALTELFLPPNYYYWILLFGWFSPEPVVVAFSNTLAQILALFLLWRILLKYTSKNRFGELCSAIGVWLCGVNWAWFLLAVKIWNPNSLVLFSLVFVAWLDRLFSKNIETLWQKKLELIGFGFFVGFFVGFHTTSILIVPTVLSLLWVLRWGKKSFKTLPLVWLAGLLAWTPYWIAEMLSGWKNTWGFIQFLFSTSSDLKDLGVFGWLAKRLTNLLLVYPNMINTIYFDGRSFFGAVVLAIISVFTLVKFSRSHIYFKIWLGLLGLFVLAAANLEREFNYHYMVLVLPLPIITTILFLSSLDIKILWRKVIALSVLVVFSFSFYANLERINIFIGDRLDTQTRDLNTNDYKEILNYMKNAQLATLCVLPVKQVYQNHFEALKYHNEFITKTKIDVRYRCDLENLPRGTVFLVEKKASSDLQSTTINSTYLLKQESIYELRILD